MNRWMTSTAAAMRSLICITAIASLYACSDDDSPVPDTTPDAENDADTDATVSDAGADADATAEPDSALPDTTDSGTDVGDVTEPDGQGGGDTDTGTPEPTFPVDDCDPLDPALCSLPWPSNLYLQPDDTRPTGYTLRFGETTLPANRGGRHVNPEPFARLDGYGWGVPIMTVFPNVDLDGLAGEESLEVSLNEDSKTLLFEVTDDGLVQVPHWVELDLTVSAPTPQVLFLRPAVVLEPSTRYIVAFRDLLQTDANPVPSSEAFAALRDNILTEEPAVETRRAAFESMFAELSEAGVERTSLTLAWDFVTGSEETLHAPVDTATRLALEEIGDAGATLTFDNVERDERPETGGENVDDEIAIRIEATMQTPSFVRDLTGSGADLLLDEDGLPQIQGTDDVFVRIMVPHRAVEGEEVGVIVYGHGLLGNAYEIDAGHLQRVAEELGYVLVSVAMRGMSDDDAVGVLSTTFDMSNFSVIADGLVQGMVQTHVLARTAKTRLPGLLRELDADINIDTDRVHWFGGSQGGIFGTTVLATSPDMRRGILAVPGVNYSTMLQRSINFEVYFEQLRNNYGAGATTAVMIAMAQLRWDFTDPISYWRRLVELGNADTNPSAALLLVSKADKQVAVVTNEIVARTYPEVAVMAPYDTERTPYGITQTPYPHTGSGMILFDFGNPWPTGRANLPPSDPLPDPHPRIAEVTEAAELLRQFLDTGVIIDVCGGDGCTPR
jgi:pimeloyl-ACP methyl ester carboxylesterase